MAEGEAGAGAHHAGLEQRLVHAGYGLHGHDGVADGCGGHIFLAQGADGAQLAQVLKAVGLFGGNEVGAFPRLQLARADGEDAQHVLTAIAGHS